MENVQTHSSSSSSCTAVPPAEREGTFLSTLRRPLPLLIIFIRSLDKYRSAFHIRFSRKTIVLCVRSVYSEEKHIKAGHKKPASTPYKLHLCPCCLSIVVIPAVSLTTARIALLTLGFFWAPGFTWGCGVSLRLLALHCGNIVIALRDHSCRLGPDLNWLQSEGAEAAVRVNHESATAFLFSPQSLNQQKSLQCENPRPIWQQTKPERERERQCLECSLVVNLCSHST